MLIGYRCWQVDNDYQTLLSIVANYKWEGPIVESGAKPLALTDDDLTVMETTRHHPHLGIMSYKHVDNLLENEEDVKGGVLGIIHPYGTVRKHKQDETGDAGYRSEKAQILAICNWARCDFGSGKLDEPWQSCPHDAEFYNGAFFVCKSHYLEFMDRDWYIMANKPHVRTAELFENIAKKYDADLLSFYDFVRAEEDQRYGSW